MPFPTVWGIPKETPKPVIDALRLTIVAIVSETMECKPSWVRPFFPVDLLDEPTQEDEGCKTIFVDLNTAMFYGNIGDEGDAKARSVTKALAETIWKAFQGRYEVEVFISNLNPTWRTLIKAKE